ncbi:MAG: hypothetical protein LBB90_03725 [Tannerella sp.]|jgi:protein-S-isoprenylcysteine O-methyltransferase Ste14|nr:hypothetical protein [Tannerella sp.]
MKRFLFLFTLMMSLSLGGAVYVYAQEAPADAGSPAALDLTTFTGIVAAVSLVVTQLAKIIPVVAEKTWLKILVSVGVAILASLLAWHFGWAQFLQGLAWWMAVFYGAGAGLTASGAYDLIKSLFTVKTA